MLALIQETTQSPEAYAGTRNLALTVQSWVTVFGILVGGSFALYKFFFEGAFSERLQPSASAVVVRDGPRIFLRASVSVENIGKSVVEIDQGLTRLGVSFLSKEEEAWTEPDTPRVLKEQEHKLIDPGETIADQTWGEVRNDRSFVVARLEFYVTSTNSMIWMHREMVSLVGEEGTIVSQDE